MIPKPFSFLATGPSYQSAPYPSLEGARAAAKAKLSEGHSSINILLLIGGSEYLVEEVRSDPCHKITYFATTKSCEGVTEDSFEGPTLAGATAWAEGRRIMTRVMEVQIYLRVAGRLHPIDIIDVAG